MSHRGDNRDPGFVILALMFFGIWVGMIAGITLRVLDIYL